MGEWGKIRSWHAVRTFTRGIGMALSLCGKTIMQGPYLPNFPADEKSCESCLRILRKIQAANQ